MSDDTLGRLYLKKSNNLDAIRLVAAIFVIYGHAREFVVNGRIDFVTKYLGYGFTGGLAVDAFFVISGFLITASMEKGNLIFYVVSRVLRIFPALWVCTALLSFVICPLLAGSSYNWSSAWTYFWHISTAWRTEFFIDGAFHGAAINGPVWSVLLEIRLYIVIAALYIFGVLSRPALFNFLFFAALVYSYLVSPSFIFFADSPTAWHVIYLFMVGSFFFVNRDSIKVTSVIVLPCIFLLAIAKGSSYFELCYLLTYPYIIIVIGFGAKLPWPRRIGDYSYGIYLWGWPIQYIVSLCIPDETVTVNQLISIPVAVIIGALSWHFLEHPILTRKHAISEILGGKGMKAAKEHV